MTDVFIYADYVGVLGVFIIPGPRRRFMATGADMLLGVVSDGSIVGDVVGVRILLHLQALLGG
jgi:hypothetical protein